MLCPLTIGISAVDYFFVLIDNCPSKCNIKTYLSGCIKDKYQTAEKIAGFGTSVCKDGTQVRLKIKEVRFYFDYLVSVSCLSNLKKLVLWCKFL